MLVAGRTPQQGWSTVILSVSTPVCPSAEAPMSDIILTTLNAKYIHSSFGLRYLKANLGPLESQCTLMEYTIQHRPLDIVQELLAANPKIIGMESFEMPRVCRWCACLKKCVQMSPLCWEDQRFLMNTSTKFSANWPIMSFLEKAKWPFEIVHGIAVGKSHRSLDYGQPAGCQCAHAPLPPLQRLGHRQPSHLC